MATTFTRTLVFGIVALVALGLSNGYSVESGIGKDEDLKKPRYRYQVTPTTSPVSQGQDLCAHPDIGGQMVAVSDLDVDTEIIAQVAGHLSNDAWTSGRRNSISEPWIWTTTGEPLSPDFHHWGNPSEKDKVGCIYYSRHMIQGLVWYAGDCNDRKLVICQVLVGDDCSK